jgi:acetyl esterase/lipase
MYHLKFPRTMIVASSAEMLVDQINTLVERMRRDLGEKVHYHEAQDAVHDLSSSRSVNPSGRGIITVIITHFLFGIIGILNF